MYVACSLKCAPVPAYARVHAALSAISVVTSKELEEKNQLLL